MNILICNNLTDCEKSIADIDKEKEYPWVNYFRGQLDLSKQQTITWAKPHKLKDDVNKFYFEKPDIDLGIINQSYEDIKYNSATHKDIEWELAQIGE